MNRGDSDECRWLISEARDHLWHAKRNLKQPEGEGVEDTLGKLDRVREAMEDLSNARENLDDADDIEEASNVQED